jgi:hypothetical protein
MSRYIVVDKSRFGEMHVLKNGNMSFFGTPRKFLSKEAAREVAASWAQHFADCGREGHKVVVRTVV